MKIYFANFLNFARNLNVEIVTHNKENYLLLYILRLLPIRHIKEFKYNSGHLEYLIKQDVTKAYINYQGINVQNSWYIKDSFWSILNRTAYAISKKEDSVKFILHYKYSDHNKLHFIGEIHNTGRLLETAFRVYDKQLATLVVLSLKDVKDINFPVEFGRFEPNNNFHFGIYLKCLGNRLNSKFNTLNKLLRGKIKYWSVAISRKPLNGSRISWEEVESLPGGYLADPFLVRFKNKNLLFAEYFDLKKNKGSIVVYEIKDDKTVFMGTILENKFHHSYPFVFTLNNNLYMCPETAEVSEINLYESKKDPLIWTFKNQLMNNIRAVDNNVFLHNGRWWLFSNIDSGTFGDYSSELWIFYCEDIFNPKWKGHTKNPIYVSSSKSRNGGFFTNQTGIFRVSQKQSFSKYGSGIQVNRIIYLDENNYEEENVDMENSSTKDFEDCHHLSKFSNLVAVDYLRSNNEQ